MTTHDPAVNAGPIGSFELAVATDTWTWSEQVFAIHGFAPGEVVPTTELVLSHKHPEDREAAAALIRAVRVTGEPFAFWHRLVDAAGTHRHVLSTGAGVCDPDGRVVTVRGQMVDLSDAVRRSVAREVEEAIAGLAQSRHVIEQVKGALMATYRVDADTAFAMLRRYSQLVNVKVRDVARELAESLPLTGLAPGTRELWDRLASGAPVELDAAGEG